ncbi:hypothetical protein ACTJJ0_20130 [Chitinophaga sp. 22321]|uniref:Secreted protein n=1 Tax=Chitinophaga hostae TaxID=2831022 RepID=A0ABS5IX58_9BACT|nr:hypothetical protein [Chitinophaga hostae]MBS0027558.1 hypothetical protein [Chitinophaga hostae]
MKQAKFALTAVAVLAVIGGALAFKANSASNKFYSTDAQGQCKVSTVLPYVVDTNAGTYITNLSTASTTAACPQITLRFQA